MKGSGGKRRPAVLRVSSSFLGAVGLALGAGIALVVWRRASLRLARFVGTDPLTGGRSFVRFQADAEKVLTASGEGELAVLVFDISRFKDFNDAFGCAEGDRLILALDQLLDSYDGPGEFHAHVGGDRFVALLRWTGTEGFAARFARLDEDANRLEVLKGRGCRILCFGGVAVFDGTRTARRIVTELVDRARYARECVGESPRSAFALYTEVMKERDAARRALQAAAVDALAEGRFVPYYQPKVSLATGEIVGFEALARWLVPGGCTHVPSEFVDPLEGNGFIVEVDLAMFRQVCAFLRDRITAGLPVAPVACNFSRLNLRDDRFVPTLLDVAAEYCVPCKLLELELTESIVMEDLSRTLVASRELESHGFKLAIDDFGSGYSSLGTLQELPVDVLKIDRSLLVSSEERPRSRIVFESVVAMAAKLGVNVVVEGVETTAQAAWLAELDPGIVVQGYVFSPPVPEREAAAMLDRRHRFEYEKGIDS